MHRDEILSTYNRSFAKEYDEKFLLPDDRRRHTEFEADLIRTLIPTNGRWLDVACGTGYYLSRFPSVERAGLDLSAAMLDEARPRNPGVEFREASYLEPQSDWVDRWDLVSCMFFAYTFVESITDMRRLFRNLAAWTSPGGACFLPACPCDGFLGATIPFEGPSPYPGRHFITAIMWSWVDNGNDRHRDLIAPQIPYLVTMFEELFEDVQVVRYPPPVDGWADVQRAIVCRRKTSAGRS